MIIDTFLLFPNPISHLHRNVPFSFYSLLSVLSQDLVPEHAGSLFGVMNTAGAIPGFVGVYMTGFILHLSNGNWEAVFVTTAIICKCSWRRLNNR